MLGKTYFAVLREILCLLMSLPSLGPWALIPITNHQPPTQFQYSPMEIQNSRPSAHFIMAAVLPLLVATV
jgi:hypothetical protein